MARRYSTRRRSVNRSPARKFVWARHDDTIPVTGGRVWGANLLEQFQSEYGRSCSVQLWSGSVATSGPSTRKMLPAYGVAPLA